MKFYKGQPIKMEFKNNKILIIHAITEEVMEEFIYWTPPTQTSSVYKPWSYTELIQAYDNLMALSNGYMTKKRYEKNGNPILTKSGYELFSYTLEPETYSKTIFIQAGIHGNEMDGKQQLYRLVDILVNKTDEEGYERFKALRNDCRLVVIPCVSPYGHEHASKTGAGMNVPYTYDGTEYAINLNRNYDFNQQWALASAGVGGYPAMSMEEIQHTQDILFDIGLENIHYAMDWHDGGAVEEHYWINYALDSSCRIPINDLLKHLIQKNGITEPIIPNCKDTSTTGVTSMYMAKSLGLIASTVEWIGGLLGYAFDESQMTQSMELRGNMVLMAYECDFKGWEIYEKKTAKYFHFDYPKAFTREGFRYDGSDTRTIVTDAQIYSRWDKLVEQYPTLVEKSDVLGTDVYGEQNIHTYTFGNGDKKVLYVGGIMRFSAPHKIDEFAIYELIEYLCNDYIVAQSKFLQSLRNDYTIIVLPCIDNSASNTDPIKKCGLNNMALSYKKWQLADGKCQPTTFALSNHDIPILKKIIDDNPDLKCIISGGEDMTKYGTTNDYTTEFETQIVIPKNQAIDNLLEYKKHLEDNRDEIVSIENTVGTTIGDYAYDNFGINTYYIQLHVSKKFTELSEYHTLSEIEYLHSNYEAGRRIANIVNIMLI